MSKQYAGETCVLAYSGGLDTSVAVAWLRETLGFEVVTCTGDLGATGDLEAVQRKAIASGARKAIVQDARDIFLRYFVWPALQAGARNLLGAAPRLSRDRGLDVAQPFQGCRAAVSCAGSQPQLNRLVEIFV